MFLDSENCKKISLGSTEMACTVYHGLASHFHQELLSCLEKYDYLVVSFDEVFNEFSNKEQIDLVCRYFDEVSNKVTVR